jgi:hypothetical protein
MRRLFAASSLVGALLVGGCGTFDITNPNQPTLDDLVTNPTRAKLSAAATGLFISSRGTSIAIGTHAGIQDLIWRLGSMGREGARLDGNNQPDYQEPYFGPLSGTGFGRAVWDTRYQHIRSVNTYLTAVPKVVGKPAPDGITQGEADASIGFAKTLKALAFMYIVETHAALGAPVDVDQDVSAAPAPFVSEDSVYGYILGLLNDAQDHLNAAAGATFPFLLPPGYSSFNLPATFLQFNRALAAKAYLLRATAASSSCGLSACYNAALTALGASFVDLTAANLQNGVYYDFSTGANDATNDLSEPLNGTSFFALPELDTLSQSQNGVPVASGGTPDQRFLDKVGAATGPLQILAAIPIPGTRKFVNYFTNGNADPNHSIPVIKNEELILLRAEANIGLNQLGAALSDINFIRQNSGKLPPLAGFASQQAAITELLYNRRYSLLWEQGTSWIDARRYNRFDLIPIPPGFANGPNPQSNIGPSVVPNRLLIPDTECSARGLPTGCSPLGT